VNGVVNNEKDRQFEISVDGQTAILKYVPQGNRLNLVHTEVPPALGGRGIAGQLAKAALEYAQSEGLQVIPSCPFVRGYLERHSEYAHLTRPQSAPELD